MAFNCFGSIGDIIAISQIIALIVQAVNDSKEAETEYHQLLSELISLQKALKHILSLCNDQSDIDNDGTATQRPRNQILDSIKFAVVICRQPLEDFLEKIQKYNKAMSRKEQVLVLDDISGSTKQSTETRDKGFDFMLKLGSAARRIQWTLTMRKEIQRLQNYLNLHVGIINVLLAEYCLENMKLDRLERQNQMKEMIETSQSTINRLGGNINMQSEMLQETYSRVEVLLRNVTEWDVPLKSMADMTSQTW
jgi:hypothetical protein